MPSIRTVKALLILTENDPIIDGADVKALVDMAVVAEADGIDSVMMSEHLRFAGVLCTVVAKLTAMSV